MADVPANTPRPEPTVVVVQGESGSGKTYVARRLAADLKLPLVAKDDFKELLFERLGWVEDLRTTLAERRADPERAT